MPGLSRDEWLERKRRRDLGMLTDVRCARCSWSATVRAGDAHAAFVGHECAEEPDLSRKLSRASS